MEALPNSVYSDGIFTAKIIDHQDGTWTTYYSSDSVGENGWIVTHYYAYTSGAVTGGTGSGDAVVNGGGVCLSGDSPQFTMRGGAISGNTALAAFSYGGGWCEAFAG